MAVIFDEKNMIFNLQTPSTSYIIGVLEEKALVHIHYGKRIEKTYEIVQMMDWDFDSDEAFSPINKDFSMRMTENMLPAEFPNYGSGDYRTPVFHARYADGSTVSRLYYKGHKIYSGKPDTAPLPSSYTEDENEAQTLEITLYDELTKLEVIVCYSVYNDRDIITRSHKIINNGENDVKLQNVLSGCISFTDSDYDFVNFSGAWARERHIRKSPLSSGIQCVESLRGSSSHMHNPFICLSSKNATEDCGDVYGINLVYSGNFVSGVYVDSNYGARLYTGINPFDFEWNLQSGETFVTPECVMTYSDEGFGKMSRTFHSFVNERICRGFYRDKERPVLINNWEATYFDFNEEKIVKIAEKASEVGVELMVLDDGWFGKRDDDTTSLGDWFEDKAKLPNGIEGLAEKINKLGMKFGLWFEPEMISEKSELYKNHPDWCLHVNGRSKSEGRQQLILDYSRDDACDYIIDTLSDIFKRANIEYIKWDMNRNMSEIGSALLPPHRQRETAHRYMLGLYRVLGTLKERFPKILMEGCSGGGGRFDLGMFCFFDQFWTSDDTDAIERQYIQTGTSYGYPFKVMGAHVSAVPNHQVGRVTDINTRGYVAMPGQFGYELDLSTLSDEEIDQVKKQIVLYKELSSVFHNGEMHRIISPFEDNMTVWEFVSDDKNTVIVDIFTISAIPKGELINKTVKLKGLEKSALYKDRNTGRTYSGEVLMNMGIKAHPLKDFDAVMMILEKVNK